MARVKRTVSKQKQRLIAAGVLLALAVLGVLLWVILSPQHSPETETPGTSQSPDAEAETPENEASSPEIETEALPESTLLSEEISGDFTYLIYEDYAEIKKYAGESQSVTIPETLGEKPVMSVGESAFLGKTALEEVALPSGLRRIGSFAFSGCISLSGITLPESTHEIGDYAFTGCTSLKEVHMTTGVKAIGTHAFDETLYLTQSEEEFMLAGDGILLGYHGNGGSITLPSEVKKINSLSSSEILTAVYIPAGVSEIGDYAFQGCSNVSSVSIPASVKRVGENAFAGCSSLIGLRLGDGVQSVGRGAFSFCDNLKSVNYPESVTSIEGEQFELTDTIEAIYVAPGSYAEEYFLATEYAPLVISDEA